MNETDRPQCPHIPSTGRVYRVRMSLVQTRVEERVTEYLVCDRCHAAALRAIGAPDPQHAATDWRLSRAAVEAFAHVLQDSHVRAEARLRKIIPTARHQETHRGLELWRSPPSAYGLRWLIDGDLVIWVGQRRPPERLWNPKEG